MKHDTFLCLKNAYRGHINKSKLNQVALQETDPFLHRTLRLVTEEESFVVPWDVSEFTFKFRKATPQERLHQVVSTYLLRLVMIVKEEMYIRTFTKPESQMAIMAWKNILKENLFIVLTLLYNVKWNSDLLLNKFETLIMDLLEGKASALREFLNNQCHIPAPITPAEQLFPKLNFLTIGQFGSSFWRLLHWMAEAMDGRPNDSEDVLLAKNMWREQIAESMYRMLRCGICMAHLKHIVQELKPQLMDEKTEQRKLWYNIHNKVTESKLDRYRTNENANYSESEFNEDVSFMRQALFP